MQSNEEFHACPSADCPWGAFFAKDDGNILNCPLCKARYCLSCEFPFHEGETCEGHREASAERERQDAKSLKTVVMISKPCPKCKANINKYTGCDHVTCRSFSHEPWSASEIWSSYFLNQAAADMSSAGKATPLTTARLASAACATPRIWTHADTRQPGCPMLREVISYRVVAAAQGRGHGKKSREACTRPKDATNRRQRMAMVVGQPSTSRR